ncbi:hypothetical protein ACIA5G_41620 [Amycolatopsis sp. NPDC051758]|uniref:hypothetical protein n=1 Tax=Amycolatopsis sp. NPDC051758 TaxID=3363935 RepID=UPI0037AE40A0
MDECEVMWRVPADADAVMQFVGWEHPLPAVVLKLGEVTMTLAPPRNRAEEIAFARFMVKLAAAARDAAKEVLPL